MRDSLVTPEEQLISIREPSTEPEYQPTPHEDSSQNEYQGSAGNRSVRGISPIQIDPNKVFALLAEDHLDLLLTDGQKTKVNQETPVNQETYSEREVSCFGIDASNTKIK